MSDNNLQIGGMSRLPSYGRGNIDLNNRPIVRNPDGSISTVYSHTFGPDKDGNYILVPGIRRGLDRKMEAEEAFDHYLRTGEHLGVFKSIKESDDYANSLHEDQAKMYMDAMGGEDDEEPVASYEDAYNRANRVGKP